jgi:hypothetical protein
MLNFINFHLSHAVLYRSEPNPETEFFIQVRTLVSTYSGHRISTRKQRGNLPTEEIPGTVADPAPILRAQHNNFDDYHIIFEI